MNVEMRDALSEGFDALSANSTALSAAPHSCLRSFLLSRVDPVYMCEPALEEREGGFGKRVQLRGYPNAPKLYYDHMDDIRREFTFRKP